MPKPFRSFRLGLLLLGACAAWSAVGKLPEATPAQERVRLMAEAVYARDTGDTAKARAALQELLGRFPEDGPARQLLAELDRPAARTVTVTGGVAVESAPAGVTTKPGLDYAPIDPPAPRTPRPVAPPPGPADPAAVAALVKRGRSQYLAGDPAAAAQTLARALELDPANAEARALVERVAAASVDGNSARTLTSAQMRNEVQRAWQRPAAPVAPPEEGTAEAPASPLAAKLDAIVLPNVAFSNMELSRVVNTLSAVSEEYDRTGAEPRGVNIVLIDRAQANPPVNLTLRNLTLRRVLDFITAATGYQYEVQADAVVVRPAGDQAALETGFFPVSRSTVLRMTGRGAAAAPSAGADSGEAVPAMAVASRESEGQGIRNFLQLAGVVFTEGSTLAFDGSQLIVTQTPRNLERIRNILRRYSEVRQVEIEAKFMEVQDGALEELGVNWNVATKATQRNAATATYATSNRSLASAFSSSNSGTSGLISRPSSDMVYTDNNGNGVYDSGDTLVSAATQEINLPILNNPPSIPGTNNVGLGANALASITGVVGEFNVNAVVRALSQKSGTELLSAPKLTVLSGNPATITVAQELRYPQSFGQVQSQVGTGSASGGGSAGVTITAGTPQEFTTRNVGVELKVTPTVEEDDHSVSLDLNPKVTEFEGFVEYGGQSVAVSGSTTVTVPSGFYQPIFAVRELTTKVTIWDGATLIMGGLTREDVRRTNDKVPVIGNVPVLGRLFRSDGESAQKRNLLIFVTANLVSPGGSLKQQAVRGAAANSVFQNPTIVTPAGPAERSGGK